MTTFDDQDLGSNALCEAMRTLLQKGLCNGAAGNASVRFKDGMLITASGIAADKLCASDMVFMQLDGSYDTKQRKPSSEWRMHADLYRSRTGANAVVHCHSNYATILACAGLSIPAQHYMVAAAGNDHIPLATYQLFGTEALSNAMLNAIGTGKACLLANHGQIVLEGTLEKALTLAEQVEQLALWYWGGLQLGKVNVLDPTQMADVSRAFTGYGQQ